MTPKQNTHLERIQTQFLRRVTRKYVNGAREHGGLLTEMPIQTLVEEAINECVDAFTYLQTLHDKLNLLSTREMKALNAKMQRLQ